MTEPAPRPTEAARPATTSFARAFGETGVLFGLAWWTGLGATHGILPAVVAAAFVAYAARRGVLRSQAFVMAGVAWLVLGSILELVFLDSMPAAPLLVLLGILAVQYLLQLGSDLRAFARAGDSVPPVTYAVTFALVALLAFAAEMFRVARTVYPVTAGGLVSTTIAASFLLLLAVWWDWTRRAFSSLKMAVTLLALTGLGSLVGTIVIQHMPEDSREAHHEKFMNGEGAAPVNARHLFADPEIEWSSADETRRAAMNEKFGPGEGDRWAKLVRQDRVKKAKETEGRAFVDANRDALQGFYDLCERARFTRIFKSWYFNALLVLLALTVTGVMARRWPYRPCDAGWVAAHGGIVFTLACLAASDLSVRDGFVQLAPTASPGTTDVPTDARAFKDLFDGGRPRGFGWTLRLVRTSADWYQELAVAFAAEGGGVAAQQNFPVRPGRVIELERPSAAAPPRYRLEMLDVVDRCRTTEVGYRRGKSSELTALQLVVDENGASGDRWVTGDETSPLGLPGSQLVVVVAKTAEEAGRAIAPRIPAETGAIGFVRVTAGDAEVARLPATVGQAGEFDADGRRWRLVVSETTFDVQRSLGERKLPADQRTPVEKQIPGIGGATLLVSADGIDPQRANAFSGEFDEVGNGQMANPVLKKAGLAFHLDLVVPREVRVVVRPDDAVVAVIEDRGTVSTPRPLREGDALPVEGAAIRLGKLVRDAELDVTVEPLPPESDADYMKNGLAGVNEQPGRPAVRLRVTEPGAEPYEMWVIGGDPWLRTPLVESRDKRLKMVLTSTAESMYRSAVRAIAPSGDVLGEHVVRVNSPFRLGGYEFYQNQFMRPDQGGPMAVFRVKYDPFVPFLYAGFALISIGVIVLLWFPGQRAFKLHAHLAGLPEEGPRN